MSKDQKTYCQNGKECFAARADAQRALGHMKKRKKAKGSVYLCELCNTYHITHMTYADGKNVRSKSKRKIRR